MTIHLTGDREELIRSLIEGGQFATEDEVIDEALRLLREREDQSKLDELRGEIVVGIEQADRGETAPFDPQATLSRIRSRGAGDPGRE
jgi:antitoxin ParD1/3/4